MSVCYDTPGAGYAHFPPIRAISKHRKLIPTAAKRYLWGRGDESTLETIETELGTIGSAICWENYMPLLRQTMYSKGADIECAPTVDERQVWASTMRHIALEGRCFVISANQYLRRSNLPEDAHPVQGDDPDTVLIASGNMIVSPWARCSPGQSTIVLDSSSLTSTSSS